VLTACGTASDTAAPLPDPADWASVTVPARGQTLDWYMYNGDEAVNAVVEGYLTRRLADEYGVRPA